jgi:hypothetical protein
MSPSRLFAALLPVLCSTGPAYAHGLFVSYNVQPPDRVVLTAFWNANDPASGARVRMLDDEDHAVAVGMTDARGQCAFTITEPKTYLFEVIAAGHRGECRLSTEDAARLGAALSPDSESATSAQAAPQARGHDQDADHGHEHAPARPHTHEADTDTSHAGNPQPWFASGLVSGLALILAAAALTMTLALRRELRALKCRSGDEGR